uniref:Myelin and lymphocyte protein n=1 Tax=Sinocyclocheilus grahami TaxID=75366 RepID=A0A672K6M6_SINGR
MKSCLYMSNFVFRLTSTKVEPANPQGWVMFVSLFCFLITTLWFLIFITGINQSSIWPSLDVGYHAFSPFFYLSAAVLLANVTIRKQGVDKVYQLDIAAVLNQTRYLYSYILTLRFGDI